MSRINGRLILLAAWFWGATALPGQTLTTIHAFTTSDGSLPSALVQGLDGTLYGTTQRGGVSSESVCAPGGFQAGCGTVFRITLDGKLETIHNFCSDEGCLDGQFPTAALVQDENGELFGSTGSGGDYGFGTIFKVTPAGTLTVLHSFCADSDCPDGDQPLSALVRAADGAFYGTTWAGGTRESGVVFRITPEGAFTVLYTFCSQQGCADGANPFGALVQGEDGALYGATFYGGLNRDGTVFKITLAGQLSSLYSFCSERACSDGKRIADGLTPGPDGELYGVTEYGGLGGSCIVSNCGTIFKITTSGVLTRLYSFCSEPSCEDGAQPVAALVRASNGAFFGQTEAGGGGLGDGVIFRFDPGGTLTKLYSFKNIVSPVTSLVQTTDGDLYGTTAQGGEHQAGTIYRLSLGSSPFVKVLPTSATPGSLVSILGDNLSGSTRVSFQGSPANYMVISNSRIVARVPAGAADGFVKVVTPSGTLSTVTRFHVRP